MRPKSPLLALLALSTSLAAQNGPTMAPTNDAPNPYKTTEGFFKMPAGRVWGSTSAVAIDNDGESVWVAERCGVNNCVGSQLDPVLHFDKNGNLLRSFGARMVLSPHGIFVDKEGAVWVVDCACTVGGGGGGRGGGGRGGAAGGGAGGGRGGRGGDSTAGRGGVQVNRATGEATPTPAAPAGPPAAPPIDQGGHQIFKFSKTGQLLMTVGKRGGGRDTAYFTQPNAIYVTALGDFWVAEGHSSQQGTSPARVLHFDKTGKLLGTFGTVYDSTRKDEPYAFNQPHALAMDSKGRLFVGDRGYNRVKIFDVKAGMKLVDTWYQFSRPSGVFIDAKDNIYVADSESGSVNPPHWPWYRGMRVGKVSDGKVTAFIPDQSLACPGRLPAEAPASLTGVAGTCQASTSSAEGVAVDKNGVIYGAEVGQRRLQRHVRNP